ncbi:MAG: metallophosphoesterase [Halobacteriaceae archaeon]
MRVGLVSDIHSNRVALEAVLADMPPVDTLVCAGDVVGYNPWPADCLGIVREEAARTVQGNHDRMVAAGQATGVNAMARAGIEHAREQLDDEARSWLADLPRSVTCCDGRVRVVHDHPDPDRRDHYTRPAEFGPDLLGEEAVLVLGHTHIQHHEVYDDGIVVNPGSVGQPRDRDPRAAYAVLDLGDLSVTEHRVSYDVDAVVDAVADMGLPDRIGTRLLDGR